MSLTSMLAKRGLPLRDFFELYLPNCAYMQKEWKSCGKPTIIPEGQINWGFVGAAFDYRMRYFFTVTPPDHFNAAKGAKFSPEIYLLFKEFSTNLTDFLSLNDPRARVLSSESERQLLSYCYVLAIYESLFRARVATNPLFNLPAGASTVDQLSMAPVAAIDDLYNLTNAAVDTLKNLFVKPIIANPTFTGSKDVGGADGDLIIENCLVEIKTTKATSLDKEMIYQLLGYVLLDYDDEYHMDEIGFYLSRVPALIKFPLEEAIEIMSNKAYNLINLRAEMRKLLLQPRS